MYEAFGCVEIHLAGLCHDCKVIGTVRGRIYPKENRVMWDTDRGWVTSMVEEDIGRMGRALKELKNTMFYSGLGMSIAILLSYAGSSPTRWSWVFWILTYIGINVLGFALTYFLRK